VVTRSQMEFYHKGVGARRGLPTISTVDILRTMVTKRRVGKPPEAYLPLPPATFHILVALADGELHGYAIMKGVEARSEGNVRLGPGTLYGSLKRLLEAGLVEENGERADPQRGAERRRYYRLTPLGLSVVRAEARRLDAMVRAARRKKLIGERPA
jgi:DNA-binding PadR family transcriptional regulator